MKIKKLLLCTYVVAVIAPSALAEDLPQAVTTEREMVVTANPLATAAGAKILKLGGTAVDAMVAVQTVLGLVEPQASGIGGGAFVVYYDARRGKLTTFDAREKAPAAATGDRFLDGDGVSIGFSNAWQSGLSAGVPGVPLLLEEMHQRFGRLPWPILFSDAIELARGGFELTERTSSQAAGLAARGLPFFRDPAFRDYLLTPEGEAKPAGTVIRNKPYAETLQSLRRLGARGFYTGPIAQAIVDAVTGDPNIPGDMTLADLAAYEVVEREPVCAAYRRLEVCGMGPPSSGGIAVGQILGILNAFDLEDLDPIEAQTVHFLAQAGRLAFADRNLYVADSDFVPVPVEGLLDPDYLASRAALIDPTMDMGTAQPGTPPGAEAPAGLDPRAKDSGTSHISIIDRFGNALSMTTTVESSFGNGVLVRGFLLNNQLTDFSFQPTTGEGVPIANRVQPGKRPRSSMSPSIVFSAFKDDDDDDDDDEGYYGREEDDDDDDDYHGRKVEIVTGSPGGSRIIGYTAQSIVNIVDFGLDPQEAINVPHFLNRNGDTDIEEPIPGVTQDYDAEALRDELVEKFGYMDESVNIRSLTSGLSIIEVDDDEFVGGADQRRDGTVGGR